MRTSSRASTNRVHRRASAVLVVLALLGIMMTLIGAGFVAVSNLRGNLKQVEKRQLQRLARSSPPPAQSAQQNQPVK